MSQTPRIDAHIERDYMRQMVMLQVRQMNMNTGETRVETYEMDERAARHLAEEMSDFNPQVRRANELRREYDDARNEVRSLANQLEEVRNHNTTLQNTNDEAQRQIRWLERELRDANRERREAAATA